MSPVGEVLRATYPENPEIIKEMINFQLKNLLDTTSHLHFVNKNGKICHYLTVRFERLRPRGLIWGSDRFNRGLI